MEDTSDLTADRVVRMTRRDLLLRVSLAGAGLTGLATLAACGPQTPPAAPTAAAPTYTFKLRDTTFHDGTPLTADNVAFTFLRTLDETNEWYQKTGPFPFAKYIWPYVVTDQIKPVDTRTLRFQLSQPDSTFLDNLTWAGSGIISPPALQKWGRDFTLHPVGAGPFKFT